MNEEMRKRRQELSMTQQQLAEKCGLSRVFINKIENGSAEKIRLSTAIAIADALETDPVGLFCPKR